MPIKTKKKHTIGKERRGSSCPKALSSVKSMVATKNTAEEDASSVKAKSLRSQYQGSFPSLCWKGAGEKKGLKCGVKRGVRKNQSICKSAFFIRKGTVEH